MLCGICEARAALSLGGEPEYRHECSSKATRNRCSVHPHEYNCIRTQRSSTPHGTKELVTCSIRSVDGGGEYSYPETSNEQLLLLTLSEFARISV